MKIFTNGGKKSTATTADICINSAFETQIRSIRRKFSPIFSEGGNAVSCLSERVKLQTLHANISGTAAWILKILSPLGIAGHHLSISRIKKSWSPTFNYMINAPDHAVHYYN